MVQEALNCETEGSLDFERNPTSHEQTISDNVMNHLTKSIHQHVGDYPSSRRHRNVTSMNAVHQHARDHRETASQYASIRTRTRTDSPATVEFQLLTGKIEFGCEVSSCLLLRIPFQTCSRFASSQGLTTLYAHTCCPHRFVRNCGIQLQLWQEADWPPSWSALPSERKTRSRSNPSRHRSTTVTLERNHRSRNVHVSREGNATLAHLTKAQTNLLYCSSSVQESHHMNMTGVF